MIDPNWPEIPTRHKEPAVVNPNERPAPCRTVQAEDPVNPSYYVGGGGMQPLDVIDAFGLGFDLGQVIKYTLRNGRKDRATLDLRKAMFYLKRAIAAEEAAR